MGEPVLIWGAGAMGGTLGACWARAGTEVLLIDVVRDHVAACRTAGLEIERGVTPVGFDGFDPAAFRSSSSNVEALKSVAGLADFNRGTAKTHSGVWRDLAVRKRRTEIDQQIGIIATLAANVGVETPTIDRLVELVHDVEAGRRIQSPDTFNELLAVCR